MSGGPNSAPYRLESAELKGGALVRWLVGNGAAVREDQVIAEYHARALEAKARPVVMQLRAPVQGTLAISAGPGAAHTASLAPPTALATISVCTHSMLFSGSLCAICGGDVSKLPRRTRVFLEEHAAAVKRSNLRGTAAMTAPNGSASVAAANGAYRGAPAQAGAGGSPSSAAAAPGGSHGSNSGVGGGSGGGMERYRVQHGFEISLSDAHVAASDAAQAARLRASRRLCLILDLDHTLVHATNDPRAAAVMAAAAASTPDAPADDIHFFQDEAFTYYVKLRRGAREFLARAAELYELQVDTAGTRAYAQRVGGSGEPSEE